MSRDYCLECLVYLLFASLLYVILMRNLIILLMFEDLFDYM